MICHFESNKHKYVPFACFKCITVWYIRWGADKSLDRPTFSCHTTESIVSLVSLICSCAELQVFSCYRDYKEACQATRTISTPNASCHKGFFMQGKTPKEKNAILKETLGEYAPSYATVQSLVVQFNHIDFSTCIAPCASYWTTQNRDHHWD